VSASVRVRVPEGYTVERANGDDVETWLDQLAEQNRSNGVDGVYFSPRSPTDPGPVRTAESMAHWALRLVRPLTEPQWFRLWLARDARDTVVGHVDLSGGRLHTELHRAELGIGIVTAHRGIGLGPALLDTALEWARNGAVLDYIDLGVFAQNPRARRLYRRFGFEQTGLITDCFRVEGVVIDDVRMAVRLR
jgi:RimJ/RimL family protein N-acetyltransferase